MRVKQITSQHRRDFHAIYECEWCGHTHPGSGYDDTNFHENVIPEMACPVCQKTGSPDPNYRPLKPKHPDGEIV